MLDTTTSVNLTWLMVLGFILLALGSLYVLTRRRSRIAKPHQETTTRRPYGSGHRDEGLPFTRSPRLAGDTGDRPTEDDIAKSKLGEQGIPGQPPKKPVLSAKELQISPKYDPGHTA